MSLRIDESLYPDESPPPDMTAIEDRVDYVARLCAAWDFGLLPDPDVVDELITLDWREAVDRCRLLTSPTYHLLRRWHELPSCRSSEASRHSSQTIRASSTSERALPALIAMAS